MRLDVRTPTMDDHAHHGCCAAHADSIAAGSRASPCPAASAPTVKDPVCGMNVDPHTTPHRHEHAGPHLLLLQRRLPDEVRGRPGPLPRRQAAGAGTRQGRDLHLPDAPGGAAGRARQLPDLRHGARAPGRDGRGRPEPRARRHDPALLGRPRAGAAGRSCSRWAAISPTCTCSSAQQASNWLQLLLATPVVLWAGWPFFERGWASRQEPQPQHVHADRARHRRRLGLQRGRARSPPASSRPACAARTARSRSISRPRR